MGAVPATLRSLPWWFLFVTPFFASGTEHLFHDYADRDEDGNIVEIHFGGDSNVLTEQKHPRSRWHLLPKLEFVTLNNFEVTPEALRYVLSLPHLKELRLGIPHEGVLIREGDLKLLKEAKSLEVLEVCLSRYDHEDFSFLAEMTGLGYFSLAVGSHEIPYRSEQLTDALALHLLAAPNLKGIDLWEFRFSDAFVRQLCQRKDWTTLQLASPDFTDESFALLGQLPELRRLRIRSPRFTDAGLEALASLEKLEELHVESPGLTSASLAILSRLQGLTWLELDLETVSAQDLAALRGLQSLETLILRKARIGDAEFVGLRGHPALGQLFFERSTLTEASLPVIDSLKGLTYVHIGTRTEASRRLHAAISGRGIEVAPAPAPKSP